MYTREALEATRWQNLVSIAFENGISAIGEGMNRNTLINLVLEAIKMNYEIVTLANGLKVMNSSFHDYIMEDETVVPGNPEAAKIFKSRFEEQVVRAENGVEFVESVAVPTTEGLDWLAGFKAEHPDVLIVTSFANLGAYADVALVGFIATEETARVKDFSEKRMQLNKMSVAPKNWQQIVADVAQSAYQSDADNYVSSAVAHALQYHGIGSVANGRGFSPFKPGLPE